MADPVRIDSVSRRTVLKGIAGAAGLVSIPAIIAACSSTPAASGAPSGAPSTAPGGSTAVGSVHIGNNHSDPGELKGMQAINAAFQAATGIAVVMNTVDHGTFQDQITNYLGGKPDTAYTWFSGFRMKFFADQGLNVPIDDVWAKVKSNYTEGFATSVIGNDGKVYGIPVDYYPWAVFYRKSVWAEKGYTVPATWADLITLCKKMETDGLTPIAFGDKDGWPAMGTFDILNMRQNGYAFHIGLMAGTEKWTDPRVKQVYETWKTILPYLQTGALGRTWQEAAQAMVGKTAGMYFLGTFASQQATGEDLADLDFFPFPTLGTQYDAELGIDAPIDGFMLSTANKNPEGSKALLEFLASGDAQTIYVTEDPGNVAAANDADKSNYTAFQKKSAEIIAGSGAIAQFLDRDTRPDFAGPNAMQGFIQQFLTDPEQNLDTHLKSIQDFWDSLV